MPFNVQDLSRVYAIGADPSPAYIYTTTDTDANVIAAGYFNPLKGSLKGHEEIQVYFENANREIVSSRILHANGFDAAGNVLMRASAARAFN